MSRTPTLPPTDRSMWRKLIARTHPDAGGDHELFIWTSELKEHIASDAVGEPRPEPRIVHEEGRVPFPELADFAELTRRALVVAEEVGGIYAKPLRLLRDCRPIEWLAREQERGASFKQLASIGHAVGMDGAQRGRWYEIAKSVSLSQRHAGHIISKLKGCG